MSNNDNNDPPPQTVGGQSGVALSGKPSDNWPGYTDSAFSKKHISKKAKKTRTSSWVLTCANLIKMYVGIAFISSPKAIQQVGIWAAAIGFLYIVGNNIYCVYILLKARNRFKRETIIDICDLSARLYGEWTRPLMSILLIFTNACFLMCYIMYIGTQMDQIICKTFMLEECGYNKEYAIYVLLALLPIICLKQMSFIGIFSIFVLVATFIAVGLILYMSSSILSKSPADVEAENHIKLTEDDRNYHQFEIIYLPIFCANMMSLFEGNQMILNLYSEADKPENFFTQATIIIVSLTLFIAASVGYIGYLAFGETTKSVILYNLPNDDPISITAKCLYILTICGSFVLLIQPIFSIVERSGWYNEWFCPNEQPEEGINENEKEEDPKKSKAQLEGGQAQEEPSVVSEEELPWTFCQYLRYFVFRILIVMIIYCISILIPNINIMLTFAGAVLGTLVNVILPVMFYNRAYNSSDKNLKLEKPDGSNDKKPLLNENGEAENGEENREAGNGEENDNENTEDKRWGIRCCNIVVVIIGVFVGVCGLAYVIYELASGEAKADEV